MPLTIYKSSAGSGKTYTLVREYLRLLIHRPSEFRNILAITFTNKATAEMKNRIVSALAKISAGSFEGLENELTDLVYGAYITSDASRQQYRQQVRTNAQLALTHILHSYSEFSVSTIDSFFQRILRNFAKELKLPMRYEIEMDTTYALDEIIVQLLQDVGHDKDLTQWLENFTFAQVDEDKGWDITPNITRLGLEIFKEEIWQTLTKQTDELANDADSAPDNTTSNNRQQQYQWLKDLVNQLRKKKQTFEHDLDKFAHEAQQLISGYGLTEKDFKQRTFSLFTNFAHKKYDTSGTTLQKIIAGNTEEWRAKTAPNKEKIDQLVLYGGLQDLLLQTVQYIDENLPLYQSAAEVIKNIYAYGILHNLKDKLKDYRTEKNLMLISDTNNVLQAVIAADDTPFVFEKVGAVYKHLLIDEFQDTSTFQWRNLKPLLLNALGSDNTVLVVGDVKQSIYRWRGGNLNLLLSGVKHELSMFFTPHTEQELQDNYRSAQNIVHFNNHFFTAAANLLANNLFDDQNSKKQLLNAYKTVEQGIKRPAGGYVQVNFFTNSNQQDPDSGAWKQQALDALLQTITNLQNRYCPLKNIAILVRTNPEGADIARFLTENQIRVVSSESLLLKNSLKVQLLIATLHYLANPKNVIAQAEMLLNYLAIHQPQQYEVNHLIFSQHSYNPDEPNYLLSQILPEQLLHNTHDLIKKPLYETVETLLQVLNLCQPPDAYIQRFQDLILDFSRTKSADILHFLDWWQENKERDKASIIVPEGENAVTIMTIHKAKGLEFPVVILPFADWDMKPKKDFILWAQTHHPPFDQLGLAPVKFNASLKNTYFAQAYNKELLQSYMDNLNLLYVALTRPTEELYLFTKLAAKPKPNEVDGIYKLLLSALSGFELEKHFNLSEQQFTYGEPLNWQNLTPTGSNITPLTQYLSHHYQPKITLRTDSKRYFTLFDNATSEPLKMGQKIHSVLERMKHANDVDKIIKKLQIQGLLTTADEQPIKHRIEQIFQLTQVQEWFSPSWQVMAERTILHNQNNYRPDRVLLHQNQAIVIDYKTGEQKPQHLKQVNAYAFFLTQMGYTVMGKYLLYLAESGAHIVNVTEKV